MSNTLSAKRKFFTKVHDTIPVPDLVEVQRSSYKWFIEEGLQELFEEINPIEDMHKANLELSMGEYYLDEPKYDAVEAKSRNATYEAPLRCQAKLVNKSTGAIKTQEIFLGDFPLMTDRGTFIVNGVERVVVSQLIRSPGVFFTKDIVKGEPTYGAKIIPNRGAWLEIETDAKGVIYVKIDRKRKVPITSLLRAFGYGTNEELLKLFKEVDTGEVAYIKNTIEKDTARSEGEGLREVYKRIRPGDLATVDNAKSMIDAMFFNFDRYDFGKVGRYMLNRRLGLDTPNDKKHRVMLREDLVKIIRRVIKLHNEKGAPDDIDHLGNRRVRSVGELIQARFRIGLARMERIVRDRMSTMDVTSVTPAQLLNARPVIASLKEFFASSQLSQFMDQTNPLSELAHKRRLSALGPGGLSRERAGFEVRDVHRSHYGRICPIETPEGPNIGLVVYLASYSRINEYGFIEAPYRKVLREVSGSDIKGLVGKVTHKPVETLDGKTLYPEGTEITKEVAEKIKAAGVKSVKIKSVVTDEIVYLDAFEEEHAITAPATTPMDDRNHFVDNMAEVKVEGRPLFSRTGRIEYVDVSPKEIVSVSTALIPFLEHDDGQRALMGANMQRQAVSCVSPVAPVVGTGVEEKIARDSGHLLIAKEDGEVIYAAGNKIVVKNKKGKEISYFLSKFDRSNQSTCINQKIIVLTGDKVKAGQVLADGPATENGELALGQNVMVAFMSWEGGNYEDAILVSDRLVHSDAYSSIHIEDFSIDVRETKLGPEVITRDIPNVGEDKLKDLDEEGIVRVGAQVSSSDILVGKITPKGETDLTAEERLLRAIFGDKARDVKDSSLYLEHGENGKVVDVKIFSRDQGDKLPTGVVKRIQVSVAKMRKIEVGDKMSGRHGNKGVISRVVPEADMPFLEDGTPVDVILSPLGVTKRMNIGQILELHLGWAAKKQGYKVASPVLDGVTEDTIISEMKKAGIPANGKVQLTDGRTGKPFKETTSVGIMYMLKLHHLVEEKLHQRSIGPYSLVTQQPLGGKAQMGGQRFGEMEVWALEGYGAAYTLREMLTIKSDDTVGRSKTYESLVKNEKIRQPNVPASFHVLVKELKGLLLDVEVEEVDHDEEREE